jgi:flagellar protein FliJ
MAAKFEFSLEPLLDRRKRVEEACQREFARRRNDFERGVRELESLRKLERRSAQALGDSARASATADLRLRDRHLASLEAAVAGEVRRCAQLEAACERARDELIAASRERRALDRLKERRLEASEAARERREELELEEANARRRDRHTRERQAERTAGKAAL